MGKKKDIKPFSEKKQKEYERQARLQYGPTLVNESVRRWESYGKAKQEAIMQEGGEVYNDLVKAMKTGYAAGSDEVTDILSRWHNHIRYFYEPTLDILRGLGTLYNTDPEFITFFHKFHKDLPAYLQETITQYVDDLETGEIERMLAADTERLKNV
jgi:hypothetical protein